MTDVDQDLKSKLQTFFGQSAVAKAALKHLKEGVEIGVSVREHFDFAIFRKGSENVVEFRPAEEPEVVFELSASALDHITSYTGTDVGDVGVIVLQLYLKNEVKIRVIGSFFSILKNGYLGIIGEGGPTFMRFLAQHGVSNISKVPALIKKLKS